MGYRDSDDSGFSRHGMNHRDNDHHDPQQRSHRAGFDHPDLARDEDLRTSHSIPGDGRTGRYEPYGGRREGQGYQGARSWEGRSEVGFDRDRYQGQGGDYRSNRDSGYGYGARSPDIGGYNPYEAEQRFRQQQQYGSGGNYGGSYGQDDRARLNRPDAWSRDGYGGPERDQGDVYASQRGRSYGHGYDGRPDARQEGYGGNYDRQQQGNPCTAAASASTMTPTTLPGARSNCACSTRTTTRGATSATRSSQTSSTPGAPRAAATRACSGPTSRARWCRTRRPRASKAAAPPTRVPPQG